MTWDSWGDIIHCIEHAEVRKCCHVKLLRWGKGSVLRWGEGKCSVVGGGEMFCGGGRGSVLWWGEGKCSVQCIEIVEKVVGVMMWNCGITLHTALCGLSETAEEL